MIKTFSGQRGKTAMNESEINIQRVTVSDKNMVPRIYMLHRRQTQKLTAPSTRETQPSQASS